MAKCCPTATPGSVLGAWFCAIYVTLLLGVANGLPALHVDSIDDPYSSPAVLHLSSAPFAEQAARRLLFKADSGRTLPVRKLTSSATAEGHFNLPGVTITVTHTASNTTTATAGPQTNTSTISKTASASSSNNNSTKLEAASSSKSSSGDSNALPVTAFDQTVDDTECISTPEEFIRVWRSPNLSDRDRCVDESIIVRLSNGKAACDTLKSVFEGFFRRLSPLSFWAFKDAPEKYLRIGVPQAVGSYVDGVQRRSQTDVDNAHWSDGVFPGVRDQSNGVSLLTQIGFGSDFYRIDRFYMMFVGKRDKAAMSQAGVPTFVPTWDNVRVYYEHYIRQYIKSQNGSLGKPEDFSIPKEVTQGGAGFKGLANVELSDLTGCPSQCTYEDTRYPLDPTAARSAAPALTPGAYANHTKAGNGAETCGVPVVMVPKNASSCAMVDVGAQLLKRGRLRLSEPTQLAVNELVCRNPDWRRYFLTGDFSGTPTWRTLDNGTITWTGNKFPGLYEICNKERKFPGPLFMSAFVNEWNKISATDFKKKAVLFRAFLMAGCAGNFNQLFSGNGLIYTGHGGVSSATVHELLLGAIDPADAETRITKDEKLLGDYAFAFFCIDGTENCCPDRNCKPAWNK